MWLMKLFVFCRCSTKTFSFRKISYKKCIEKGRNAVGTEHHICCSVLDFLPCGSVRECMCKSQLSLVI